MATRNNTEPSFIDFKIDGTFYLAAIDDKVPTQGAYLTFAAPDGTLLYLSTPAIEDDMPAEEWEAITGLSANGADS